MARRLRLVWDDAFRGPGKVQGKRGRAADPEETPESSSWSRGREGGGTPASVPAGSACPPPTPRKGAFLPLPHHHRLGFGAVISHAVGRTREPLGALSRLQHPKRPVPQTPSPARLQPTSTISAPLPLSPIVALARPTAPDHGHSAHPPLKNPNRRASRPFPRPGGVSRVRTPAVWAAGRSRSRGSPALQGLRLPGPLNIWVRGLAFQM